MLVKSSKEEIRFTLIQTKSTEEISSVICQAYKLQLVRIYDRRERTLPLVEGHTLPGNTVDCKNKKISVAI
jgi:hypothetical protein